MASGMGRFLRGSRGGRGAVRGVRGFTLLEALLALFIFSTAVIALVEAVNSMGRTVSLSRREQEVRARLDSMLVEATRDPEWISRPRDSEPREVTVKEDDVTYVTRKRPLALANQDGVRLADFFEVSVTARWLEGAQPQEVVADTWVYPPLFTPQR